MYLHASWRYRITPKHTDRNNNYFLQKLQKPHCWEIFYLMATLHNCSSIIEALSATCKLVFPYDVAFLRTNSELITVAEHISLIVQKVNRSVFHIRNRNPFKHVKQICSSLKVEHSDLPFRQYEESQCRLSKMRANLGSPLDC